MALTKLFSLHANAQKSYFNTASKICLITFAKPWNPLYLLQLGFCHSVSDPLLALYWTGNCIRFGNFISKPYPWSLIAKSYIRLPAQ